MSLFLCVHINFFLEWVELNTCDIEEDGDEEEE